RGLDVISYPNYRDLRDAVPGLDLAAHAQPIARVGSTDAGELLTVELVTGNYFRVLGLAPRLGRLLSELDDREEGRQPVVVISEGYWRSHYAANSAALGSTVLVNSTPFEIVGVAPADYRGTYAGHVVDLWAPMSMHEAVRPNGLLLRQRGWGWLSMIGR